MRQDLRNEDHETQAFLRDVIERVWEKVRVKHQLAGNAQNEDAVREEIEKRVIEAHTNGERDAAALELEVLRAFDRWAKPGDVSTG